MSPTPPDDDREPVPVPPPAERAEPTRIAGAAPLPDDADRDGGGDPARTLIAPGRAEPTRVASAAPEGTAIAAPADARTRIAAPRPADAQDAPLPPLPEWQPVAPGVLINNNYRIQSQISAGGMGEVYRGENVFTGDPVAVKVALPQLARDENIVALFRREARILGQLTDDAIVRYHNFVLDQGLGRYCLVMEFIEGWTLWEHVRANGPIPEDAAAAMMRKVASGLAKAHARGVTHRDLSPDNVMLRDKRLDQPVLIDFGIARSAEMGDALQGRFAGKVKYAAPEQLGHFGGDVGPRTDVYGLALLFAAALRGEPLPMGGTIEEAALARRGIPNLSGLPPRLFPLLQHMLEPDPANRPESMGAVAAMLDDPTRIPARYRLPLWIDVTDPPQGEASPLSAPGAYIDSSESPFAGMPAPAPMPEPPPARRGRGGLIAAAVALALAAGGGAWMLGQRSAPNPDPAPQPVQSGTAAPGVPALPARDETTREGWLAAQPLPPCTMAWRIAGGVDAGRLGIMADGPRDSAALVAAYDARFDAAPAVVVRQVTPAQCPAVEFLAALNGRAAPSPMLSLDTDRVTGSGTVLGRLREVQGRTAWLFLVGDDGRIHDLSSRLTATADGSFTFALDVALKPGSAAAPQMVVALASSAPLVTAATATDAAPAARLLPAALAEIARAGGQAGADAVVFTIAPPDAAGAGATPQTGAPDETAPDDPTANIPAPPPRPDSPAPAAAAPPD